MNFIGKTVVQVDANQCNARINSVKSVVEVIDVVFTDAQWFMAHGLVSPSTPFWHLVI